MNQNVEATLPNFNRFKESLKVFLASTRQIAQKNKVPAWFNEFSNHLATFSDELSATIMNFETIDCNLFISALLHICIGYYSCHIVFHPSAGHVIFTRIFSY